MPSDETRRRRAPVRDRSTKRSRVAPTKESALSQQLQMYEQDVSGSLRDKEAEDDDLLIAYLEKKLKVNGKKSKLDAVMRSVGTTEFGGDMSLIETVENVLGSEAQPADDSSAESNEAESSTEADEGSADEDAEVDSEDAQEKEEKAPVAKWVPKRLRENAVAAPATATKKSAALAATLVEECRVAIRAGFNRVGEGNVLVAGDDMVKTVLTAKDKLQLSVIDKEGVGKVIARFIDDVTCCCAQEALNILRLKSALVLAAPQAALLCMFSGRVSKSVILKYMCAVLETFGKAFDSYCAQANVSKADADLEQKDIARQCVHTIALVAYFGFLDIDLFVEFCRWVASPSAKPTAVELEFRVEILALAFRICSAELKAEYTPQYQEIEAIIKGLIESTAARNAGGARTMHLEWIEHELANVGKHRKAPMYEKLQAVRGMIRKFRYTGVLEIMDCRRCLEAMLAGDVTEATATTKKDAVDAALLAGAVPETNAEEQQLRNLAKRNHIRSPLQQDVFIALARSRSVKEATTNVLECVTHTRAIEPALAVLLHCLLQEAAYNPFYAAVAAQLCCMPDEKWRNRFLRGIRHGLYLLTANEAAFAEDREGRSARLRAFIEALREDLEERDYLRLTGRQIFSTVKHPTCK